MDLTNIFDRSSRKKRSEWRLNEKDKEAKRQHEGSLENSQ